MKSKKDNKHQEETRNPAQHAAGDRDKQRKEDAERERDMKRDRIKKTAAEEKKTVNTAIFINR